MSQVQQATQAINDVAATGQQVLEQATAAVGAAQPLVEQASTVITQASGAASQVTTDVTQAAQAVDVNAITAAANGGLQEALAVMITQFTNGAAASANFLMAEVPDVLYQLVLWYGLKAGVMCLAGIVGILLIVKFVKNNMGLGKAVTVNGEETYKLSLTHGTDGKLSPHCMALVLFTFPLIGLVDMINLEWLQILVAPKIWLIEYGVEMAKAVS